MTTENQCWECDGRMIQRTVPYLLYGIEIGKFPALVFGKCEEVIFSAETSARITRLVKEKGLWGLQAQTKVGQAGKTLDIRIPKRITEFIKLKKGTAVTITPESRNKIVITV